MPYSSSDYDTAVSAFNVLPESMAVENLIRLRQGNEAGAMTNRKLARDETYDLSEDVMSKSFGKHLSETSHLSQEERQASTQQWMDNNEGSYASKAVLAASAQNELLRGASARATHRDAQQSQHVLEKKKADYGVKNFDADQEVVRAENEAKRKQAVAVAERMTNANESDADALATSESDAFAGSIQSLPLESQQKLNSYLFATEGDPDKKIIRRNLVRLAGILEGSSQLRTAQSYVMEEHRGITTEFGNWRKTLTQRGNLPPQNASELDDFEKKFPGNIDKAIAYKEDRESLDSAESSVKGLNRKLAGGPAEIGPDGNEIPAVKGLVDRLNEAQQDKTPVGRQVEAQIMGEMMSMAQPVASFVKERIRLHDSTLKSREEGLKAKKTESEIKAIEARIESSGNMDLLTKARARNEARKTSVWETRNMLAWLDNSENRGRLATLDADERTKVQDDMIVEWNALMETQRKMDDINPDGESDDSANDY